PSYCHARYLHSFPTRRSSDLPRELAPRQAIPRATESHDHPPEEAHPRGKRCGAESPVRRGDRGRVNRDEHLVVTDPRFGSRFQPDRKSTRLNSSHVKISYAVF